MEGPAGRKATTAHNESKHRTKQKRKARVQRNTVDRERKETHFKITPQRKEKQVLEAERGAKKK